MKEVCPPVYVYIKPITGRPPSVIPYLSRRFGKGTRKPGRPILRASWRWRKPGRPYEGHMVIEDLPGRKTPEPFIAAVQFQQRSIWSGAWSTARKVLDLGVRWRRDS